MHLIVSSKKAVLNIRNTFSEIRHNEMNLKYIYRSQEVTFELVKINY